MHALMQFFRRRSTVLLLVAFVIDCFRFAEGRQPLRPPIPLDPPRPPPGPNNGELYVLSVLNRAGIM